MLGQFVFAQKLHVRAGAVIAMEVDNERPFLACVGAVAIRQKGEVGIFGFEAQAFAEFAPPFRVASIRAGPKNLGIAGRSLG